MKNVKVVFENSIEMLQCNLENDPKVILDFLNKLYFAINSKVDLPKNVDFDIERNDGFTGNHCFVIEIFDEENTRIFNVFYAGVDKL